MVKDKLAVFNRWPELEPGARWPFHSGGNISYVKKRELGRELAEGKLAGHACLYILFRALSVFKYARQACSKVNLKVACCSSRQLDTNSMKAFLDFCEIHEGFESLRVTEGIFVDYYVKNAAKSHKGDLEEQRSTFSLQKSTVPSKS